MFTNQVNTADLFITNPAEHFLQFVGDSGKASDSAVESLQTFSPWDINSNKDFSQIPSSQDIYSSQKIEYYNDNFQNKAYSDFIYQKPMFQNQSVFSKKYLAVKPCDGYNLDFRTPTPKVPEDDSNVQIILDLVKNVASNSADNTRNIQVIMRECEQTRSNEDLLLNVIRELSDNVKMYSGTCEKIERKLDDLQTATIETAKIAHSVSEKFHCFIEEYNVNKFVKDADQVKENESIFKSLISEIKNIRQEVKSGIEQIKEGEKDKQDDFYNLKTHLNKCFKSHKDSLNNILDKTLKPVKEMVDRNEELIETLMKHHSLIENTVPEVKKLNSFFSESDILNKLERSSAIRKKSVPIIAISDSDSEEKNAQTVYNLRKRKKSAKMRVSKIKNVSFSDGIKEEEEENAISVKNAPLQGSKIKTKQKPSPLKMLSDKQKLTSMRNREKYISDRGKNMLSTIAKTKNLNNFIKNSNSNIAKNKSLIATKNITECNFVPSSVKCSVNKKPTVFAGNEMPVLKNETCKSVKHEEMEENVPCVNNTPMPEPPSDQRSDCSSPCISVDHFVNIIHNFADSSNNFSETKKVLDPQNVDEMLESKIKEKANESDRPWV